MNTKFTIKKGFYIPILKFIDKLNRNCTQNEIISIIKSSNFINLLDQDLETIDFNGRYRFEYAIEHCFYSLSKLGFLVVQNNSYSITEAGLNYLNDNLDKYNHNDFIHNVEVTEKNKYIYSNLPAYLINTGSRKTTIYGFNISSDKYIEILNDYLDFVDLNYPSIEEFCDFLKNNYNISTNNECLNEINVIRSCGLVKVIGKNFTLTKLGEWYINSYDNIALFRIFSSIFIGFEEIINIIANENIISTSDLKSKLNFDWINSHQFDIRLNWLKNMKFININDDNLSLSDSAIEFVQFLGIIDMDIEGEKIDNNILVSTENVKSESLVSSDDSGNIIAEELSNIKHTSLNSTVNLSQQERNFLLNNNSAEEFDDIDDYFDNAVLQLYCSDNPTNEVCTNRANYDKQSNIIKIVNKNSNKTTNSNSLSHKKSDSSNLLITPDEIGKLINLPESIILKITAAINMGKHIILTGPHGSGKTSLAVVLAKIANKKGLNNGYNMTCASQNWTSDDTIGYLMDLKTKKQFKEGYLLKSIRENKWLIIDDINKCNTESCFGDCINSFYGHNTILSYMHENYKNIEIISEPSEISNEIHKYIKNKNWRLIATMDTNEMQNTNFSPAFIRRFAFIDIGTSNYSNLIDKYFEKNELQNDLLKSKIKTIFSNNGLLKYKQIGASSIYDLVHYIGIRSSLISNEDNIYGLLAEALEIYIIPQLQTLDNKIIKEIQTYFIELFKDYDNIRKKLEAAL